MPIREESFRMGCGRYLQRSGVVSSVGEEVLRFGTKPLVVGGKTALKITRSAIENSLSKCCSRYEITEHRSTCNEEQAKQLANYAKENGFDVIVGVGGGVLMDFAKLVAFYAKTPIVNLPTSSATCAAFTPLSVCYTLDGRTVGTHHFEKEIDAVLVDNQILSKQPTRLFLAGVFDALAKFVEIKHRFNENVSEYPLGLDWAYVMSKHSFKELSKETENCLADLKAGRITDTVERLFFITIAITGVISGIARGSNQTALAHKFYEGTRTMFFEESREYLHGEIVGVGLLLQNHFNGDTENNNFLLSTMKQYVMPCSISDIGLSATVEVQEQYYEKLKNCSAINENNSEELQKLRAGLEYLWKSGRVENE